MNFESAKNFLLHKLDKELDPRLTYHNVAHTLDVYESAVRLAEMENISSEDLMLLKTAAIFHDSGMLITYTGHEEASTRIAREILPKFTYDKESIDTICEMIIATKLPQHAKSFLEKILCDADLDYLGRNDFFLISHQLKYEWDVLGINPTTLQEWYRIQVDFLNSHQYFTKSAIQMRQNLKEENMDQIKAICHLKNN